MKGLYFFPQFFLLREFGGALSCAHCSESVHQHGGTKPAGESSRRGVLVSFAGVLSGGCFRRVRGSSKGGD